VCVSVCVPARERKEAGEQGVCECGLHLCYSSV